MQEGSSYCVKRWVCAKRVGGSCSTTSPTTIACRPLTVENIPAGTGTEKEMTRGGDFILKNLKAIVETGRPPFGTRLMYAMFGALEFVLSAKTKSENWPLE